MPGPAVILIKIRKATWGGRDVKDKVEKSITTHGLSQSLTVTASNDFFGFDPIPGVKKRLIVHYDQMGLTGRMKTVPEGKDLRIDEHDLDEKKPYLTLEAVAKALAPRMHLHSRDPHRPASVEEFLKRCHLVSGSATVESGPMDLPSTMSIVKLGPLKPSDLTDFARSTNFGGNRDERYALFPMENDIERGHPKVADWRSSELQQSYFAEIGEPIPTETPSKSNPYFYNFQLKTLVGYDLTPDHRCWAPMYVRIATREDFFLISYFGFFPYNGGIGITTNYGDRPLSNANWGGHIGDWIRLTVKVKICENQVAVINTDYEAHGDQSIYASGNGDNEYKTFNELSPIEAYSSWHSHELYPDAGTQTRMGTGFLANDYTDNGPVWKTSEFLTFISDDGPEWVFYNGLWGANMKVPSTFNERLSNGPEGPAFHWYWTNHLKGVDTPIQQWRFSD